MSQNNRILLEELIRQRKNELEQPMSDARFFEFFSADQLLKAYELSYDEIEGGLIGESHDGGCDSIYLFVDKELVREDEELGVVKKNAEIELVLIQSKFSSSFAEEPLLKLARLSGNLLNLEFDRREFLGRYSEKLLSAFDLFRRTYLAMITKSPKLKIRYFYASTGSEIHPNVQAQADDLIQDAKRHFSNADVEVSFVGAEKLLSLSQKRINDVFELQASDTPISSSEQVFITLVQLKEYYRLITDQEGNLIKHIFESNVRDYQGSTAVNIEIQETLEQPGTEDFWWLNNGVTIIASEASAPGGRRIIIKNPEVVNGLQTSTEIHRYFSTIDVAQRNLDARNILIRVIVPQTEETRDKIIRATNNQTTIPKASLRATDPIHRQIEDYLKPRGLFYDRRKNYYKNEGKKPKEIISVSFLAQCLMSALKQSPDMARARPSTLLDNEDAYNKLYNANNDLHTYYLLANAGRRIELLLKESGNYSTAIINDVKFYVLYATCCILIGNVYPSNNTIKSLSIDKFTDELISEVATWVFDIYMELGGDDTVAKGSQFKEVLREKIRVKVGCS